MQNLFTYVDNFFNKVDSNILQTLNNIENGNITIDLYMSINKQDIYGNTLLHYALGCEKLKSILFLIKLDVKVDILNKNKLSILHILFIKCVKFMKNFDQKAIAYLEVSKYLINKGANINIKNKNIPSPLNIISVCINNQDSNGNTISHHLLQFGKLNTLIFLIKNIGINLNIQNNNGRTLLHFAILYSTNNFDKIEIFDFILFLLKNGASEYIKDKNGKYPDDLFGLIH